MLRTVPRHPLEALLAAALLLTPAGPALAVGDPALIDGIAAQVDG